MIDESKYFQQFIDERNLSQATIKQYKATLRQYCEFNGLTLDQLLAEADNEEEQGIRLKRRTLKTRLVDFRTAIIETDSKNTIVNKVNQVKTFYRHFEIELPTLPYLSEYLGCKKKKGSTHTPHNVGISGPFL